MRVHFACVISVITSAILWVAVTFAFFASPPIGSAYLLVTNKLGTELPLFTKEFSLVFLGNYEDFLSTFPQRALWAWGLWFILLCGPIALAIWAVRIPDHERSLAKWCVGMIAYISLSAAVAVIVSVGLVMPFTNLK